MTRTTSRRQFIGTAATAGIGLTVAGEGMASNPGSDKPSGKRIGLALGAGGANGLAHVMVIEAMEELDLRPHHIAGSSIGAVIGALYAGGMDSKAIRELIDQYFVNDAENLMDEIMPDNALKWAELVDLELGGGGLLSGESVVEKIYSELEDRAFSDLEIPLSIVTSDLWSREQVVFEEGPLRPAVQASMSLPGVFRPVEIRDRVLVDGGAVNPVPFDVLPDDCDLIVAVDVTGVRNRPEATDTTYFQTLFNSVKVMQQAIVDAKRARQEPDIFIAPAIKDVQALEFYRAEEIYQQAEPAKQQLKKALREHLEIQA
ncbi:MAG TPA: patatin-like phospholipase family protein [Xanthomonadales bacterium]|nr:patatin-like phospholipase family protein [Xanthomonadales bacterium]